MCDKVVCVCMYVCMHACMHACMYVCMDIYLYIYIFIYLFIYYVYMYVCMHVCQLFPIMTSTCCSGDGERRKDKGCGGGPTSMRHHCGFLFCASAPMSSAWHLKSEKYLAAKRMWLHKTKRSLLLVRECQIPQNMKGLPARH